MEATARLNPHKAAVLAWSASGLCLVLSIAGIALEIVTLSTPVPLDFGSREATLVLAFVFLAVPIVGALIASQRPETPIGWMLIVTGLAMAVWILADGYAIYALRHRPDSLPAGEAMAWLGNWVWIPGWGMVGLLFLLFPDGRLPSHRWRPLAWGLGGVSAVYALGAMFTGGVLPNYLYVANPVAVLDLGADGGRAVKVAGIILLVALGLGSIASLFVRLRRARGDERQQLKWLTFAGAVCVGGLAVLSAMIAFGVRQSFLEKAAPAVAVVIPVAVGVAVLRYRLYDIDVVINRTVVFGALAAFITAVYVVVVAGLGTALGTRGEPNVGLSILATAIVAVAFQPARDRVQRLANRLVYGERATPYEVLTEFSERMAGTYSVEDILPHMARIVADGMGATRAEVWLHVDQELRPAAGWPDAGGPDRAAIGLTGEALPPIPGMEHAFPVRRQDELLGALAVRMPAAEPLSASQERLLADLATQASLVLRNVRLIEELRASRQRIVAAQDAERRRLERDIHDGAQQQLVALAVRLRLAANVAGKESPSVQGMLEDLQAEAGDAMENLRDLARGIYPPLLADQGLVAALTAQTRKSTVPVEVRAVGIGRYPQEVEAAVYFCSLEALQNVAKYAQASQVVVSVGAEDGHLTFSIRDDGVGFDPSTTTPGSGLQNMADRLSALGGTVEVRSAPGTGTTVAGRVPATPR